MISRHSIPIHKRIRRCKLCEGAQDRVTKIIGSTPAKVVFITPPPTTENAAKGLPYMGREFKWLQSMLGKRGFSFEKDVAVLPVVCCAVEKIRKCHYESCQRYLHERLKGFTPRLWVVVGNEVIRWFLNNGESPTGFFGRLVHIKPFGNVFAFDDFRTLAARHSEYVAESDDKREAYYREASFERTLSEFKKQCDAFAKVVKQLGIAGGRSNG